ncbi:MAG: sulfatase-like hydrolase/transferase [Crocinitomicaceae bacterium]|tara:strand:+ start:1263 stop:2219 length:957 start_codon:yes stop_codon:yes gene_type:complete
MSKTAQSYALYLFVFIVCISCSKDKVPLTNYETENVLIIVMDGARYSETGGDSSHQNTPYLSNDLAPMGIINDNFYNNGPTYTAAGHTAMTTGIYQDINNSGLESPNLPSIFQYYLRDNPEHQEDAWIVASKGKLEVLSNCNQSDWHNKYNPMTNCGIDGLGSGSGYREDSLTYIETLNILQTHEPKLMLVNFREPDYSGHSGDWNNYLQGIIKTDEYIFKLIDFIENDAHYQGKTTVFVTNDHGRHLDNVAEGYVSHGDQCEGCKHINFFTYGPDFKNNTVINHPRGLIDIQATIATLFHLNMPLGEGKVMNELFKE